MPPSARHAALVALALAGAAACHRGEPIRLGYVGGLTGRHYDLGVSGRNGAQLAVAELNAAGGVGGRPLELLVRDDGQDAELARRAVADLAGQGVLAIIGHMTSAMAEAGLPEAERAGVLMVSPTASAVGLRGKDDGFVSLFPSSADVAWALADWVVDHTAIRRVSILADRSNLAFSTTWAEQFSARLARRGGTVPRSMQFTSGPGTSLGEVAATLLADQPEAVLVVANALDTAALCQQVRKRSASVRLLGTDWGYTHDAVTHGGSAVEGALFTQAVEVGDRSPRFTAFRDAYQARYGRPVDFAAVVSYEAVQLVAAGLRRDATRQGLRAAVLGLGRFEGLQGPVAIDRFGDASRAPRIMTIRGGQLVAPE